MNKLPHELTLGIVLAVIWLLLSGHYTTLMLFLGFLSVALVVYIALRMEVVDHEGHPVHLHPIATLDYWGWLLKAIIIANIDVCRRIVSPDMPISPTRIKIKSTQNTDLGRVIFANSITLTPGTVSMDIEGDMIDVHALSREGAAELAEGEMDRRVTAVERE